MTSSDRAEPQVSVRMARGRLLQGRGKGASQAEIDALTRERPSYAGEPVSEQLEVLLASGVDAIAARVDPRRHRPRAGPVAAAVALGLLVVLRCRRHR